MNQLVNLSTLTQAQENTGFENFLILEEMHKEFFPNGACKVVLRHDSINFYTMIQNKTQWANGIELNDPMRSYFSITPIEGDKFEVELIGSDRLLIKPAPGSYLMFDSVPCKFRKSKGNAAAVLKKIRTWQEKRLALVTEYQDRIKA